LPTNPPSPNSVWHEAIGGYGGTGYWTNPSASYKGVTATPVPPMPSEFRGQNRAYNPSSKQWEEMSWVSGVGYLSPYQMKGILEGSIAFEGNISNVKKAYSDIGGVFKKQADVKAKEPEPSVLLFNQRNFNAKTGQETTIANKFAGYDSPYLQQSVLFNKPLTLAEAKAEIQRVHLEKGIAKTRAEQLAQGYNTAVLSPFTPQALRETEIQRQTTEQTWNTKITVPKIVDVFTKEREATGLGTTWEGQPISIAKDTAVPYIVSVPKSLSIDLSALRTTPKYQETLTRQEVTSITDPNTTIKVSPYAIGGEILELDPFKRQQVAWQTLRATSYTPEQFKFVTIGEQLIKERPFYSSLALGLSPRYLETMIGFAYKKPSVVSAEIGRFVTETETKKAKIGILRTIGETYIQTPAVSQILLPYATGLALGGIGFGIGRVAPAFVKPYQIGLGIGFAPMMAYEGLRIATSPTKEGKIAGVLGFGLSLGSGIAGFKMAKSMWGLPKVVPATKPLGYEALMEKGQYRTALYGKDFFGRSVVKYMVSPITKTKFYAKQPPLSIPTRVSADVMTFDKQLGLLIKGKQAPYVEYPTAPKHPWSKSIMSLTELRVPEAKIYPSGDVIYHPLFSRVALKSGKVGYVSTVAEVTDDWPFQIERVVNERIKYTEVAKLKPPALEKYTSKTPNLEDIGLKSTMGKTPFPTERWLFKNLGIKYYMKSELIPHVKELPRYNLISSTKFRLAELKFKLRTLKTEVFGKPERWKNLPRNIKVTEEQSKSIAETLKNIYGKKDTKEIKPINIRELTLEEQNKLLESLTEIAKRNKEIKEVKIKSTVKKLTPEDETILSESLKQLVEEKKAIAERFKLSQEIKPSPEEITLTNKQARAILKTLKSIYGKPKKALIDTPTTKPSQKISIPTTKPSQLSYAERAITTEDKGGELMRLMQRYPPAEPEVIQYPPTERGVPAIIGVRPIYPPPTTIYPPRLTLIPLITPKSELKAETGVRTTPKLAFPDLLKPRIDVVSQPDIRIGQKLIPMSILTPLQALTPKSAQIQIVTPKLKTITPTKPKMPERTTTEKPTTEIILDPALSKILYGGQVKKGKKAKKSKLMFKFKAPKYEIMPLPDIISVIRTEATTWKKAHALYPTQKVKKAFARAVAERPFAWHFPTAEIVKKKWKGGLF
jgi:hypothetical protein